MGHPVTDALLELVLTEWGPGAVLCWDADGTLVGSASGFRRMLGLDEGKDAGVEAIWSMIRERCTPDPGDLASAFVDISEIGRAHV